jgi:hypothetical protein
MALPLEHSRQEADWIREEEGAVVKPMAAALAGALISGVGMYAIGTHAQDRFATYDTAPQAPVAQPVGTMGYVPQRTVYREVAPAPVSTRVELRHRSVAKTAMIIGGSTAGAAGLGGLVGGKKGALIGAALGGGAASIYEATHR